MTLYDKKIIIIVREWTGYFAKSLYFAYFTPAEYIDSAGVKYIDI